MTPILYFIVETILKKELSLTVAGTVEAGAIDVGVQYLRQTGEQAFEKDFNMDQIDYTDFTLDPTSLGIAMGIGSVLLPTVKNSTNSLIDSTMATWNYNKQISNAKIPNKTNKLMEFRQPHLNYIGTVGAIKGASNIIPKIPVTVHDNIKESVEVDGMRTTEYPFIIDSKQT